MSDLTIRTATPDDAASIHALIEAHQAAGHLLPRDLSDVRRRASAFVVADVDGRVMGCAELAALSPAIAEVRSLVVDPDVRGLGVARDLVDELRHRAAKAGFESLTAFTHDPGFFVKQQFSIVPHLWVPEKVARDCTRCAWFRQCGQHAMLLPLRASARYRVTVAPEAEVAVA